MPDLKSLKIRLILDPNTERRKRSRGHEEEKGKEGGVGGWGGGGDGRMFTAGGLDLVS